MVRVEEKMEKKNFIEVQGLYKQFKNRTVLTDIHVKFEAGKIYGIVGRNGSGKSVFLKCICGFIPPTAGTIRVNRRERGGLSGGDWFYH